MNTFKRKSLFTAVLAGLAAATLTGCGLTPKQLQALDGAMCTKIYGATTTLVAGAAKNSGMIVNGENCSIATQGKAQ